MATRQLSVNESTEALLQGTSPDTGTEKDKKGFPKGVSRVIIASTEIKAMGTRKGETTADIPFISLTYSHIAKFYGMKASPSLSSFEVTVTGNGAPADGQMLSRFYGSKGAKSIKLPVMKSADEFEETTKGNRRHYSIPVPAWATLDQIFWFLKDTISANHPTYFVSPHGRTHPIKLN